MGSTKKSEIVCIPEEDSQDPFPPKNDWKNLIFSGELQLGGDTFINFEQGRIDKDL